jgi:hypothetical protein
MLLSCHGWLWFRAASVRGWFNCDNDMSVALLLLLLLPELLLPIAAAGLPWAAGCG